MDIRKLILACLIIVLAKSSAFGAQERVYGLESVKITQVFDPNAPPNMMMLVSGSLKLVGGGPEGSVWHTVTYIPQRPAVPRHDYGLFQVVGNQIIFFSILTYTRFLGTVHDNSEKITLTRVNTQGQEQSESWYFVR